jgi:predicted DsbA family dithiol-disulfide isomerase
LDIEAMLDSGLYVNEVQADAHEAAALGARGVPFFVFNRKYAVSGAQPVEHFRKCWTQRLATGN